MIELNRVRNDFSSPKFMMTDDAEICIYKHKNILTLSYKNGTKFPVDLSAYKPEYKHGWVVEK